MRSRDDTPGSYCLRCYQRLQSFEGASSRCDHCGFLNLRVDLRRYWTREPKLVETEWLAKAAVVLVVGLICVGLVSVPRVQFGMAQGWAIGLPIALGGILWQTASQITSRSPYFRAGVVWGVLFGVVALLFALTAAAFLAAGWTAVGLLLAVPAVGVGWLALRMKAIGRWHRGWRLARMRSVRQRAEL